MHKYTKPGLRRKADGQGDSGIWLNRRMVEWLDESMNNFMLNNIFKLSKRSNPTIFIFFVEKQVESKPWRKITPDLWSPANWLIVFLYGNDFHLRYTNAIYTLYQVNSN